MGLAVCSLTLAPPDPKSPLSQDLGPEPFHQAGIVRDVIDVKDVRRAFGPGGRAGGTYRGGGPRVRRPRAGAHAHAAQDRRDRLRGGAGPVKALGSEESPQRSSAAAGDLSR